MGRSAPAPDRPTELGQLVDLGAHHLARLARHRDGPTAPLSAGSVGSDEVHVEGGIEIGFGEAGIGEDGVDCSGGCCRVGPARDQGFDLDEGVPAEFGYLGGRPARGTQPPGHPPEPVSPAGRKVADMAKGRGLGIGSPAGGRRGGRGRGRSIGAVRPAGMRRRGGRGKGIFFGAGKRRRSKGWF